MNWIDNDSNSSWIKLLLGFLSLNIGSGQPASESRMGMVPADTDLVSSDLLHHFHEVGLVNRVNRFYTNGGSCLRHGENIDNCDSVVIMDLSHHQAHHLEGDSCTGVLQHLQKGQTTDVDLLTSICQRNLGAWGCSSAASRLSLRK